MIDRTSRNERSARNHPVYNGELGRPARHRHTKEGLLPVIRVLLKGEACIKCRRMKKRCDGIRPKCGRCVKSRRGGECVYDYGVTPNPVSAQGETAGPMRPSLSSQSVCLFNFNSSLAPSGAPNGLGLDVRDFENPPSSDISIVRRDRASAIFRRTIFAHYCKLGILVNCAKEMAITSGDRSGTFVHPVYIDFAQFYGCHTYRLVSSDWSLSDLELELEKRLRTALSEMDLRGVFDYAQAHLIIGLYLVFSEVTTATKYIKHATSIIEHNPHTFLPSLDNGPPPATPLEPSEEVQQRFALIAHLVNCRSLLRIHASEKTTKAVPGDVLNNLPDSVAQDVLSFLEGPPDGTLSNLDRFFSVRFWEENKSRMAPNPLTIGATTMLLALEARSLGTPKHGAIESLSDWRESALRSIQSLSLHLEHIDETLSRYNYIMDPDGSIFVQSSQIIALVAMAELSYHLSFAWDPKSRQDGVRDHYLTIMEQVVTVANHLPGWDDLQKVHVYTRYSLQLAIDMCTQQMVSKHSRSLPRVPDLPHECDLGDCLGVHILPLAEAYETLSITLAQVQGLSM